MAEVADAGWLVFGAIATLKGTVALAGAAVVALALRRASAAARHLAWLLGLCGLLATPVLMAALPGWQALSWPSPQVVPVSEAPPPPQIEPLPAPAPENRAGQPLAGKQQAPPAPVAAPQAPARRTWPPLVAWAPLAAWACGVLLVVARTALGLAQARRLGARSYLIREGAIADQARIVARELGLRRYALRQAGRAEDSLVPMTWGWLVPTVLLPFEATEWSAARLRAVLLHEMGHARRGDWAAQMLASGACALFWFHPLAWLAARQLRIESERATDDCVLRAGVEPASYSSDLLEIARLYGQRSHTIFSTLRTFVAIPMARAGMLEDRLQAILDPRRPRRAIPRALGLAAALLAAGAVVPLATAQVNESSPVLAGLRGVEENPLTLAQAEDDLGGFALSPDGKSVLLWSAGWGEVGQPKRKDVGVIQVWDVATHSRKADLIGHTAAVQRAIWSSDGSRIASQSWDGTVALWDAQGAKMLHTLASGGFVSEFHHYASREMQGIVVEDAEQPALLGFSADGSQVLATAGKIDWPKQQAKGANGKPSPVVFPSLVQPLLRAWDTASGREVLSVPLGQNGWRIHHRALSPDGKRIIVSTAVPRGAAVRAVGVQRMEGVRKIETADGTVLRLQPVPSGMKMSPNQALVDAGSAIQTFDAQSGALLRSWSTPKDMALVELSPDGSRALCVPRVGDTTDDTRAQLFDVESGQPLQVLAGAHFQNATFSRDNRKLLIEVPGGLLEVFDIAGGQRDKTLSTGFSSAILKTDVTPDGKYLLAAQRAGHDLLRWDLSTPLSEPLAPRPLAVVPNVRAIQVASDGSYWVGWGDFEVGEGTRVGKALELRRIAPDGKVLDSIEIADRMLIDHIRFSPDFSLAAAALRSPVNNEGAGVGVWSLREKKLLWRLPGQRFEMRSLSFSPNNSVLLTASPDGIVQEWDMATGKLLRTLFRTENSVVALHFSPDGKQLAIGTGDNSIVVLAMPAGEKIAEMNNGPSVASLAWSPDGKRIASGGTIEVADEVVGTSVSVWEVESQNLVAEFSIPQRLFGGLAFSPDGKSLAVAHVKEWQRRDEGQVNVWDIASKRLLLSARDKSGVENPAFAPDGKTLVTTNGQWLKAWDLPANLAATVNP